MEKYVEQIKKLKDSDNLIEKNLLYVLSVAHKYRNLGMSLEDLVQEGNLGLIHAFKKFDKNRNVKFITFAVHYIKLYIRKALIKQGLISESYGHRYMTSSIINFIDTYNFKYQRNPTVSEISKEL